MCRFIVLALVCVFGLLVPESFATIQVKINGVDQYSPQLPDGSGVTINTSYAGNVGIEIIASAAGGHVGDVNINATATGLVTLWIGAVGPGSPDYLASVGHIDSRGGTSRVQLLYLLVSASGSVDDIDVVDIDTAYAGTYNGHVICSPASGGQTSNITHLHGSYILGDVLAESGYIFDIGLSSGSADAAIGTSPTSRVGIRARDYIRYITANAVYADISGPSGSETSMQMGQLSTFGYPFAGSLQCNSFYPTITPGVFVTNANIDADIHVVNDFDITTAAGTRPKIMISGGSSAGKKFSGTLVIDGALKGAFGTLDSVNAIELPSDGLSGQMIIRNDGDVAHPWSAPVKIGSIVLDDAATGDSQAPEYGSVSSPVYLGGGAIGVVPFGLYKLDCKPAYADATSCDGYSETRTWPAGYGGGTRQTIILRYRGPVYDTHGNNASYPPVTVERRTVEFCTCCRDDWREYTTACYGYDSGCDIYVPGNGSREVWISRKLDGHGDPVDFVGSDAHRITPVSSGGHTLIRCDNTLAATAPDIDTAPYIFTPICEMRPGG
jgi:hypothetical protein